MEIKALTVRNVPSDIDSKMESVFYAMSFSLAILALTKFALTVLTGSTLKMEIVELVQTTCIIVLDASLQDLNVTFVTLI